jgi:hypothetical protein
MDRRDLILAALSTADGSAWTPVQVQKLFFLIDMRAAKLVGGPFFHFTAFDYGPFDPAVYDVIEGLAVEGAAVVDRPPFGMKTFSVTSEGVTRGRALMDLLHPAARKYVQELSSWVRQRSFKELVSAVYKEYPEMKVNSVFREY